MIDRTRQRNDYLQAGTRAAAVRHTSEHLVLCEGEIPAKARLYHVQRYGLYATERVGTNATVSLVVLKRNCAMT